MPRIDHARVESGELGDQKLNVLAASVYTPYERDETPQASDRCRNQVWYHDPMASVRLISFSSHPVFFSSVTKWELVRSCPFCMLNIYIQK